MRTRKKISIVSIMLRVCILCVLIYFVVSLTHLCSELVSGQKRLNEYKKQIKETDLVVSEYKTLLSDGNDAKIIEKAARERLGYVYADEQVFIDVSGS